MDSFASQLIYYIDACENAKNMDEKIDINRKLFNYVIDNKDKLTDIPNLDLVVKNKLFEFIHIQDFQADVLYFLKELFDIELHVEHSKENDYYYEVVYDTDNTPHYF